MDTAANSRRLGAALCLATAIAWLSGCSTAPVKRIQGDPKLYYSRLCPFPRAQNLSVSGDLAIQIQTSRLQGRFSATARADANDLDLEITHLFGGRLAYLGLRGPRYSIDVPMRKEKREGQGGSWAGIPMDWAKDLFLGRVPCRPVSEVQELAWDDSGRLVADAFTYELEQTPQKTWVKRLTTRSKDADPIVAEFGEPQESFGAFPSWSVDSKEGSVRFRWTQRNVAIR